MDASHTPGDAPEDHIHESPPPPEGALPPSTDGDSTPAPRGPSSRYKLVVALLIVVASLAGAGVAWSASVSSTRASDLDQLAQQQFLEVQQILTSGRADIAEELRRVGTFQQEIQAERFFEQRAKALAGRYPALAAQLASEAQGQASLARNTGALFFANTPRISSDGTVTYDRRQALNNLLGQYVVYQQLHPEQIQAEAAREHTKSGHVVGVGFVLVAALFFLTLAQVARTRSRHAFLVAGTGVLILGLVLWLVVLL
ncbi:MAG TPA: hypothetical protein VID47_12430 [Actinomycetota bacterium]|jgi:hypothetical protein